MSRKSIILALAFVALVALALAACSPTEVVKTVVVTQEVQVAGTPVIQEVVVTATPPPVVETAAPARTLVICMGQEPDTMYPYGGNMVADVSVQNAIYDGPIETNTFAYQPVIFEKLPNLKDGDAVINKVAVKAGDTVVDNDGNPATLTAKTAEAAGTKVRPAGCRTTDCAVEYDGSNVTEMDQMQTTVKLKPGILWSDGTPLTTADMTYAFSLYMDPATPVASRYAGEHTASYVATDDTTVVWTGLPGFFDSTYMIEYWGPLPKHIMEQYTAADMVTQFDAQGLWMGWGPYIIDAWNKGQEITAHKNPNYWRASEGLPKFENLVFRFTGGDANASIAAVLAGECDIVDTTTALEPQALLLLQLQAKAQINASFVTGTTFEHSDFNISPVETIWNKGSFAAWVPSGATTGPFGDARLRQAVAQCIDRQSLVDTVMYGQSVVLDTYLPPNHPLYNADVKHYAYDKAASMALLDEIGWKDADNDPATPRVAKGVKGVPDNTPLEFAYNSTNSALRTRVTQIVAQNLADCGIKADITLFPASQWFAVGETALLAGRRFDFGEFAWSTGVEPPCNLYQSGNAIPSADNGWSGQNYGGYVSSTYDAACNMQLQSLPGEDNYVKGAKDAQLIFSQDLPVVPYFLRLKIAATRPDMCNFLNDPTNNSEMWNIEAFDYGAGCK